MRGDKCIDGWKAKMGVEHADDPKLNSMLFHWNIVGALVHHALLALQCGRNVSLNFKLSDHAGSAPFGKYIAQ